jgi:hypothetical protein
LLPPWEAVIMHVPVAAVRTVDPTTVHTRVLLEVNETGSPDVAVASKVTGTPTCVSGGWLKLIA